jgi:hypothetical protein
LTWRLQEVNTIREGKTIVAITREVHDLSGPFNYCKLEAKANTKKRYLLLAGPLDCKHHAFGAALPESTRDEDTTGKIEIGNIKGHS